MPRPLGFRCDRVAETSFFLLKKFGVDENELNNTQFDGAEPITLRCARQVGQILKYLRANDHYEPYYRFYM